MSASGPSHSCGSGWPTRVSSAATGRRRIGTARVGRARAASLSRHQLRAASSDARLRASPVKRAVSESEAMRRARLLRWPTRERRPPGTAGASGCPAPQARHAAAAARALAHGARVQRLWSHRERAGEWQRAGSPSAYWRHPRRRRRCRRRRRRSRWSGPEGLVLGELRFEPPREPPRETLLRKECGELERAAIAANRLERALPGDRRLAQRRRRSWRASRSRRSCSCGRQLRRRWLLLLLLLLLPAHEHADEDVSTSRP